MDVADNTAKQLPDASIADQRAAHDVDAKLREGAERARQLRESRGRGNPEPIRNQIESKYLGLSAIADAIKNPPERILRLTPDEGDPPAISPLFRDGMIPARFRDATLDSYEPKTRSQGAALSATRFWLERAKAGEGCMLALIGPQGTGKSHLLYAAANALLNHGTKLYARPWYRLADELRYGGEHPVTKAELEPDQVRRALWQQKLVMLDEVRPTASTAFDDTELTKFACHAYDSRYPMFITSNVNPLADVMGGPAASRFTQVVIDGPDARQMP